MVNIKQNLTIITGPMFAGKSTKLVELYNTYIPEETLVFNHSFDNRYDGENNVLVTHTGNKLPCIKVNDSQSIYNRILEYTTSGNLKIKNIIIDECQFFQNIDNTVNTIFDNLECIENVICAGLDLDAKGHIFNPSFTKLFTISNNLIILESKCYICKANAQYSICLKDNNFSENNVLVGSQDIYQPACKLHLNY